MNTVLKEQIQHASEGKSGQVRIRCPNCSHQRKKKHEKTMSLSIEGEAVLYNCWHCDISGRVNKSNWSERMRTSTRTNTTGTTSSASKISKANGKIDISEYEQETFTEQVLKLLEDRKLSPEKLQEKLHLVSGTKYYSRNNFNTPQESVGFPYLLDNVVNAIKWRSLDGKEFTQDGSAQTFWNIENAVEGKPIIVVEGEFDVCSLISCELDEHYNVLSVPNGACLKVAKEVDEENDKKFKYLYHAKRLLENTERIVLAVDNDTAGENLKTELSRRLGRSKLWIVDWGEYKDANECLINTSSDHVRKIISDAKPIPMAGLYDASHYEEEYDNLYDKGKMVSFDTGLDLPFELAKGLLVLSTGLPSEGKSSLVDQICMNMAVHHGWKTNYMSFEKPPAWHMCQLSQLYIGKPYFEGAVPRMSKEESIQAKEFIQRHFTFQDYLSGSPATVKGIVERGQKAVASYGSDILVIDPWNFIQLESGDRLETDAISRCLSVLQQHAKASNTLVIVVCHPAKPADRSKKFIAGGMDVSGSFSFFAKSDIGFTVSRNHEEGCVDVFCWKVRWNFLGDQGSTKLDFDVPTGRYKSHVNNLSWDVGEVDLDF